MSVALLQEVRFAISFKQQPDLTTALGATDMWSLRQTNTDLIQATPINEDDANDLGKGVYVTETFPSHIESGGPWNGRLTSEAFAQIANFGIGKSTKATAGSGFSYTMNEPVFATDGINLPLATVVEQIRTSTDAITDKLQIGMACEEFGIELKLGPGRDNALFTSQWLGTGGFTKPSGVTIPDLTTEHGLNAGTTTVLTLIGFDYLANKRFANCTFKWKNNIRDNSSYFPGSGSQSGYQLRGRIRRGVPAITLTAQVECDSGSNEEDLLLAQTSGTGQIQMHGASLGGGVFHGLDITFHKMTVKTSKIADLDGIASYNLEYFIEQHPTDGVLTIVATTGQDSILAVGP